MLMVLTGEQIRAARAILQWKAVELAEKAGVGLSTVQRAEGANGPVAMMRANMEAIRRALEGGGVEFIDPNGGGPGVRLKGTPA
jgi:hypothetical protein